MRIGQIKSLEVMKIRFKTIVNKMSFQESSALCLSSKLIEILIEAPPQQAFQCCCQIHYRKSNSQTRYSSAPTLDYKNNIYNIRRCITIVPTMAGSA